MKCKKCGHEWLNKGRSDWICCPNCHSKFRRPPEEGIEAMNVGYFLSFIQDQGKADAFLTTWLESINARRHTARRRELDEGRVRSFLAEYGDPRFVDSAEQRQRMVQRISRKVRTAAGYLGMTPEDLLISIRQEMEGKPDE